MRMFRLTPNFDTFVREVNKFQQDLDSLFGRQATNGVWNFPALNIWEDDDQVFVEAELPGYQLNDLEIFVVGTDQLVLKGERKPAEHPKAVCHRQERNFGVFNRSVTLPTAVDADKVEAKFENGVLKINLAKSPIAKPKKINISAS
jgi:HSP20 family protein